MNAELTHQVVQALRQTDEWDRIWKESPELQRAKAQLDTAMAELSPAELRDSLWSALNGLIAAIENTSILYGMHVNAALSERA